MGPGKRDRWASSSEDETDTKPKATRKKQTTASTIAKVGDSIVPATAQKQQPQLSSLPLHNPLLQGCRSVYDTYERIERMSEGTYGVVWKARDLVTNEWTALKQIKFDAGQQNEAGRNCLTSGGMHNDAWKEGFPVTALREISILLALSHESIVSVKEMVVGDDINKVFMVMELFDCDLKDALSRASTGGPLAQSELKGILTSILSGTQHMHNLWYLHRDLKPSNILVKMDTGRIALADFGLARRFQDPAFAMTIPVVTLWYRSPELLFGETKYGAAVDLWSVGCIMGELIKSGGNMINGEDDSNAILKEQGELDQIDQIFSLLGIPNETTWPSFSELPNAKLLRWKERPNSELVLRKQFPIASSTSSTQTFLDANGYDLLKQLLTLDPSTRINADNALKHPYFSEGVSPRTPEFFTAAAAI